MELPGIHRFQSGRNFITLHQCWLGKIIQGILKCWSVHMRIQFLKIAAFEGKQLIGMVRVVGDGASVILIQDLLVRPEYQRKGIGSQLMRAVLERCEDVYQIELMTDNTEKTILFYQSLGLKKVDEIGCCAFFENVMSSRRNRI